MSGSSVTIAPNVLLTGAGGRLGSMLRQPLLDRGYALRLSDRHRISPLRSGETFRRGNLKSRFAMRRACKGMDIVLHLGAVANEAGWDDLVSANVVGLTRLLDAAHKARVRHFVFASTMHVLGMYPRDQAIDENCELAPDTRYAVTKAFGEAACRYAAGKYGMTVTVVRIGHVVEEIGTAHPGQGVTANDLRRLVLAVLADDTPGFRLVHAVAPYPNDRATDGRLERYYGFSFEDRGSIPATHPDATSTPQSFGRRGHLLRGGTFADLP
jgi:uronate dehydrogenase